MRHARRASSCLVSLYRPLCSIAAGSFRICRSGLPDRPESPGSPSRTGSPGAPGQAFAAPVQLSSGSFLMHGTCISHPFPFFHQNRHFPSSCSAALKMESSRLITDRQLFTFLMVYININITTNFVNNFISNYLCSASSPHMQASGRRAGLSWRNESSRKARRLFEGNHQNRHHGPSGRRIALDPFRRESPAPAGNPEVHAL